jgi:hypothetical protein
MRTSQQSDASANLPLALLGAHLVGAGRYQILWVDAVVHEVEQQQASFSGILEVV